MGQLASTFREMLSQIQHMKIEAYERRLEIKETQLKYLQIQSNPHFFLNILNLIYTMAVSGKGDRIPEITLELIRHTRYVLSIESSLVPLKEELEFTRNFLAIQKARTPYAIDEEETGFSNEALQVLVPPLILQTFVENAVKYAVTQEGTLEIRLTAKLKKSRLHLTISDNGRGFPRGGRITTKYIRNRGDG